MLFLGCSLLILVASVAQGQQHGHQSQSICHSNHQQLNEDQVIHNVVMEMDEDGDGEIQLWETYYFFGELLGRMTPERAERLKNMTDDQLEMVIHNYLSNTTSSIDKQEFSHAWHVRFHDSLAFIESAFDNFVDHNDNGFLDGDELMKLRDDALSGYDANSDSSVQTAEMETFLESIYHNPNCVDIIGR